MICGNDRHLRGGAEGPVGLGTEHPDPLPGPARVHALTHRVDDSGPVAVRYDPRERHHRPEPAAPLLGIARIDAGQGDPDPGLSRTRLSRWQLASSYLHIGAPIPDTDGS